MNLIEFYRNNPALVWEILKFIRPREVAFIHSNPKRTKRYITIINIRNLWKCLYRFFEKGVEHHFFASIEYLKKFENGKKLDLKTEWHPFGWDLVLDIDEHAEDVEERIKLAYEKARKIVDFLFDNHISFRIHFTGSKGFHIYIPWKWLKEHGWLAEDYGKYNRVIAELIWEKTRVKTDVSTLSKQKDLIRVPFSVHPETGLLCYPLTLQQFKKFKIDMAYPENIDNTFETNKLKKATVTFNKKGTILNKEVILCRYSNE